MEPDSMATSASKSSVASSSSVSPSENPSSSTKPQLLDRLSALYDLIQAGSTLEQGPTLELESILGAAEKLLGGASEEFQPPTRPARAASASSIASSERRSDTSAISARNLVLERRNAAILEQVKVMEQKMKDLVSDMKLRREESTHMQEVAITRANVAATKLAASERHIKQLEASCRTANAELVKSRARIKELETRGVGHRIANAIALRPIIDSSENAESPPLIRKGNTSLAARIDAWRSEVSNTMSPTSDERALKMSPRPKTKVKREKANGQKKNKPLDLPSPETQMPEGKPVLPVRETPDPLSPELDDEATRDLTQKIETDGHKHFRHDSGLGAVDENPQTPPRQMKTFQLEDPFTGNASLSPSLSMTGTRWRRPRYEPIPENETTLTSPYETLRAGSLTEEQFGQMVDDLYGGISGRGWVESERDQKRSVEISRGRTRTRF